MILSADDRFNQWNTWPADNPNINPVDYWILGKLQKRVYRRRIHDVVAQLKSRLMEELQHFDQMIIDKQSGRHSRRRACIRACGEYFEQKL